MTPCKVFAAAWSIALSHRVRTIFPFLVAFFRVVQVFKHICCSSGNCIAPVDITACETFFGAIQAHFTSSSSGSNKSHGASFSFPRAVVRAFGLQESDYPELNGKGDDDNVALFVSRSMYNRIDSIKGDILHGSDFFKTITSDSKNLVIFGAPGIGKSTLTMLCLIRLCLEGVPVFWTRLMSSSTNSIHFLWMSCPKRQAPESKWGTAASFDQLSEFTKGVNRFRVWAFDNVAKATEVVVDGVALSWWQRQSSSADTIGPGIVIYSTSMQSANESTQMTALHHTPYKVSQLPMSELKALIVALWPSKWRMIVSNPGSYSQMPPFTDEFFLEKFYVAGFRFVDSPPRPAQYYLYQLFVFFLTRQLA